MEKTKKKPPLGGDGQIAKKGLDLRLFQPPVITSELPSIILPVPPQCLSASVRR